MDKDEEQQDQAEPKKEKAMGLRLPVRKIADKDGSALVEWIGEDGFYHRVYVPLAKLDKGTVATKDLEKGIPYGLSWEQWIEIEATPERIANELRRMGVWCWQDITHTALTAVNKAFDQGEFLRRVKQEVDR